MMNTELIKAALEKAKWYCDFHKEERNFDTLKAEIIDWYNHTDITDPEMLAAAALEYSSFELLPFSFIEHIVNIYFPRYAAYEENETWFDF